MNAQRARPQFTIEEFGGGGVPKGTSDRFAKDLLKAGAISLPVTLGILLLTFEAFQSREAPPTEQRFWARSPPPGLEHRRSRGGQRGRLVGRPDERRRLSWRRFRNIPGLLRAKKARHSDRHARRRNAALGTPKIKGEERATRDPSQGWPPPRPRRPRVRCASRRSLSHLGEAINRLRKLTPAERHSAPVLGVGRTVAAHRYGSDPRYEGTPPGRAEAGRSSRYQAFKPPKVNVMRWRWFDKWPKRTPHTAGRPFILRGDDYP